MNNTLLRNSSSLFCVSNSHCFFNSSVLSADLLNRFLLKSSELALFSKNGLFKLFIEFSFKLPFSNNLLKFKNRIHFLLYYLFFETLFNQRPLVSATTNNNKNISDIKNKRELKKAQLVRTVDIFSLKVALTNFNQIIKFLNFIIFFLGAFTDKKNTIPSKFVPINLETSEMAVVGIIKNFSILPFSNLIDDLSGSSLELKFKLVPFSKNLKLLGGMGACLLFFLTAIGLKANLTDLKVLNLRKNNCF